MSHKIAAVAVLLILVPSAAFIYNISTPSTSTSQTSSGSCLNSANPELCHLEALNVPTCQPNSSQYSVSPISVGNFSYIEPLGHVSSPQGHIFPVDHIYFYLNEDSQGVPKNTTILSPGKVTVYEIDALSFTYPDHVYNDYAVLFAPCSMVIGKFDHLSRLSVKLNDSFGPPYSGCSSSFSGSTPVTNCQKSVDVSLNAGDLVGWEGGPGSALALDLVGKDYSVAPLQFANESMYTSSAISPYAVCPLDYFTPSLRASLYSYLGGPSYTSFPNIVKRTVKPLCGSPDQDVPGTAQGNWFPMGTAASWLNDYPFLALIHNDVDGSQPVFSVGNSTSASGLMAGEYYYNPAGSGLVNRDFGGVSSDGQTYCYQSVNVYDSLGTKTPFIIILQLVNPNTLRIERLSAASCGSGPWSFTSDHTDFFRMPSSASATTSTTTSATSTTTTASSSNTFSSMSFPSGWQFAFFHSNLLPGLTNGSKVTAGQLIGYANFTGGTDFDMAWELINKSLASQGWVGAFTLDSIFNHMSPAVLQDFAQRGVSPASMIISKETRDASPCTSFTYSSSDWVTLDGPITSATTQSQSNEAFIVAAPVDLNQINQISKFRSCEGHDYSGYDAQGLLETNRSMKHYFAPLSNYVGGSGQVKEFAPFNGTIDNLFPETQPRGNQVWITPNQPTATTTTTTPTTASTTSTKTGCTTTSCSSSSTTTTAATSHTAVTTSSTASASSSSSSSLASAASSITTGSTATSTLSTVAISSRSTTTTTPSTAASSTSLSGNSTSAEGTGGAGVPEYQYQLLAVVVLTLVVVLSYVAIRHNAKRWIDDR